MAKPAFDPSGVPQGAHERIAFGLAHLLELPVPPVQLWINPDNGEKFAISAFPFRQPVTWDAAQGQMSSLYLDNVKVALASGLVFHTWIHDTDHGSNGGNVLVDAESNEFYPSIAFIDHAYSMSHGWTAASPPCQAPGYYYGSASDFPHDVIADVVRRVQAVGVSDISDVVSDVPSDFLPPDTAQLIRDCLQRRQAELAPAFGQP